MRKPLGILPGDLVIAGPKLLLVLIGQTPDPLHQDFCFLHKHRERTAGKYIGIYPHLLRRRNDDPHSSSPNICAGLSAAFTLPKAFMIIPF